MYQSCYKAVTELLQSCYRAVTELLLRCEDIDLILTMSGQKVKGADSNCRNRVKKGEFARV